MKMNILLPWDKKIQPNQGNTNEAVAYPGALMLWFVVFIVHPFLHPAASEGKEQRSSWKEKLLLQFLP